MTLRPAGDGGQGAGGGHKWPWEPCGRNVPDAGPGGAGFNGEPADLTADWCSSPPRFVGKDQLWASCQDNGFMALRFASKAYARR